jgi:hypothetical protein
MRHRKLRNRFAAAASLAIAAFTMTAVLGAGAASAGPPPAPSLGTYPHWYVGAPEQLRDAGSDTTYFMLQHLSDLYMQAGLYGCQLNSAASPNYSVCLTGASATIATSDVNDNYDHIEILTGLGKIGSGDGQKQLCGNETAPFGSGQQINGLNSSAPGTSAGTTLTVDFARSSKAIDTSQPCEAQEVAEGYAKDGVPAVDFPNAEGPNPGTGVATDSTNPQPSLVTGNPCTTNGCWNDQVVGPVAAGWLPGDATNCDALPASSHATNPNAAVPTANNGVNACSGTPLTNLSNVGGTSSEAYRLWCNTAAHGTGTGIISDWAELTNITGTATNPGDGATIANHPLPVLIANVNSGSGTTATWLKYLANGCTADFPNHSLVECGGNEVLENNDAQFSGCAASDFSASSGTAQAADEAAEVASTLYFISNGVYNSNVHSRVVTVPNGSGGSVNYAAVKTELNGVIANSCISDVLAQCTEWNNDFPTARTLFNIYRSDTVRASAADFINWICDNSGGTGGQETKNVDYNTGVNYNLEVTSTIQTLFGFIRLTDGSSSTFGNNECPLINVAPAVTDATFGSGSSTINSTQGFEQAGQTPVVSGDLVTGTNIPSPCYVANPAGSVTANTITLTCTTTGANTGSGETVTFSLHSPNT